MNHQPDSTNPIGNFWTRRGRMLGLLSLAMPLAAAAQSADPDQTVVLDKFTVDAAQEKGYSSKNTLSEAGRISTLLLDTPQSIQIVTPEILRDLNQNDMLYAVQLVSGGIVRRSFNAGDDQFIWGFRTGSALRDGSVQGAATIGLLYNVDRVEVLKGPIAMTYGQAGFVGGVINYVTRQPTPTLTAEASVSYGSFSSVKSEVHFSEPASKSFRFRVDAGGTSSDYDRAHFSYYKDIFGSFGTEYDISERTRLKVDASYGEMKYNRGQTFIDSSTNKIFAGPSSFSYDTAQSKFTDTFFRTTATLTSTLGPGFAMSLNQTYFDTVHVWARPLGNTYTPATFTLTRVQRSFYESEHGIVDNLDFVKTLETGPLAHTIVFGGNQSVDLNDQGQNSYAMSPLNVLAPGDGGTVSTVPGTGLSPFINWLNNYSKTDTAYLQDTINFLKDKAYLIGGLRWNTAESWTSTYNVLPLAVIAPTPTTDDKTVYRWAAVFKPIPGVALHAAKSQAYIFNQGNTYLNVPFKPSLGNEEEVGVKADLFEGQFTMTATYFHEVLTNVTLQIIQGPNDPQPGQTGVTQQGQNTNKGYEVTAGLNRKVPGGELDLIGSLYSGHILNQLNVEPSAVVNNTAGLLAKFTILEGVLKNLSFGMGVSEIGSRLEPVVVAAKGPPRLPAYTTYSAFVAYTTHHLRFQVNGDNLGNAVYSETADLALRVILAPSQSFRFSVGYIY